MPLAHRTLTTDDVAEISAAMFEPTRHESFGVELEWAVHRRDNIAARPGAGDVASLQGSTLPAGGRITFEPGGQVELSTAPATCVDEALRAAAVDATALHSRMRAAGLVCETLAVDDRRPPRRILERPRYAAMERFFAAQGPAGAWMMCNTASTQINISHDRTDAHQRWHTMHRIAPVLIAAFSNSPGIDAEGQHWASRRQAIWWSIDPARTRPVRTDLDPEDAWQQYALAADVMFINDECSDGTGGTAVAPGLCFGRWMAEGHATGWPTVDDYRYHLTTLFPPVRPRGWLELRVLDALPGWIRDVALLTVAAACTTAAGLELTGRLPDTSGLWLAAARDGIDHPVLATAARTLFEIVADELDSITTEARHREIVEAYAARYVRRGRAPGSEPAVQTADLLAPRTPALTYA